LSGKPCRQMTSGSSRFASSPQARALNARLPFESVSLFNRELPPSRCRSIARLHRRCPTKWLNSRRRVRSFLQYMTTPTRAARVHVVAGDFGSRCRRSGAAKLRLQLWRGHLRRARRPNSCAWLCARVRSRRGGIAFARSSLPIEPGSRTNGFEHGEVAHFQLVALGMGRPARDTEPLQDARVLVIAEVGLDGEARQEGR